MTKILIVNPDQKLVEIFKPNLSRYFLVDSATDGLSALRKLKVRLPDVVVSEYQMSRLSGRALLKFVRGHKTLQAIPFIFLTNHPAAAEALSLGASDWLATSTSSDLLIERIHHHLRLNRQSLWLTNR